jgi:ATP-dependent helicase/nuclease subunit A
MNIAQAEASNPSHSVWVSASAGTGKTKILTDRVLKLLLSGVEPPKILCLTFTNAAASEMLVRINRELKTFAQSSHDSLLLSLRSLLARDPKQTEVALAKSLFSTLLHAEQPLQIQTIHGFCQGLLRKFPFEAGIRPGFTVIDELLAKDVLKKSSEVILSGTDNEELSSALKFLAINIHDITFDELMLEIINSKVKFKILLDHFSSATSYELYLRNLMQVHHRSKNDVLNELVSKLSDADLKTPALREVIGAEATQFNDCASHIFKLDHDSTKLLRDNAAPCLQLFDQFKSTFLTATGDLRARIIPASTSKANPELEDVLRKMQVEVRQTDQTLKSLSVIESSKAMFVLAQNIITKYEEHKTKFGYLDYDDLIYLTQKLLKANEFKEWILYKLDGMLEHILVDEAQDTSPQQWQIIESLMQEFYAGEDDKTRTVFVVGDEKQSIYSFQGADLKAFKGMNEYLQQQMQNAAKEYHIIDLELGYRSTKAVMDIVTHLFQGLPGGLFAESKLIECFRATHPGRVELWPLTTGEAKSELFWPLPNIATTTKNAEEKLAQNIANYIKTQMDLETIMPSTARPIAPGDIMILVRRRGRFTNALIQTLHDANLEVCGIDRLELANNLAVLDLISLAKFVLQPLDDLNLAALLKSPLVGISEDELRVIAAHRNKQTIWQVLQSPEYISIHEKLYKFMQINLAYSASDFFHAILGVLGYKNVLLTSCGDEAEDAINEFLNLANNFTQNTSTSLQEFILWFERNQIEIKRDIENSGKIRIMTIHAAKGLQAGLVILADTVSQPVAQDKIIWTDEDVPIWSSRAKYSNDIIKRYRDRERTQEYQEYLRLLYVAMTRAEDHLIIAGYSELKQIPDGCWYQLIKNSMNAIHTHKNEEILIYETPGEINIKTDILENILELQAPPIAKTLPPIIHTYSPHDGKNDNKSTLQPQRGITYGKVFHKVLEDVIKTGAQNVAESHPILKSLHHTQSKAIAGKIKQLLALPAFQEILEMQLYTEVSIASRDQSTRIGRIDLLGVAKNKVVIIDYKTDKRLNTDIPELYKEQLAFYKSAIQKIYQDHEIEAKILWLENLTFSVL